MNHGYYLTLCLIVFGQFIPYFLILLTHPTLAYIHPSILLSLYALCFFLYLITDCALNTITPYHHLRLWKIRCFMLTKSFCLQLEFLRITQSRNSICRCVFTFSNGIEFTANIYSTLSASSKRKNRNKNFSVKGILDYVFSYIVSLSYLLKCRDYASCKGTKINRQ